MAGIGRECDHGVPASRSSASAFFGRSPMSRDTFSLLLVACLAGAVRADVLVVDPQGGPGGALLNATLAGAQDGDILLLKPGDYTDAEVTAAGKLVSLVADAGGAQITLRRLVVTPSFHYGTILVRGIRAEPLPVPASLASGLIAGGTFETPTTFWLEDCTVFGNPVDPDGPGPFQPLPGNALTVGNVTRAVVVRCEATGAAGLDAPPGGKGATGGGAGASLNGNVVVDECTFT